MHRRGKLSTAANAGITKYFLKPLEATNQKAKLNFHLHV